MNLQPPDPPEYGHCLTCHRSVHESEVRGGHCIECEEQTMASKTIYQFSANTSSPSWTDISKETFDEYSQRGEWLTRALLAAPVVERQPSAWLHTMFMELDQRRSVPTLNPEHPFGICGRDFSPTYTTQSDPLFTQPPAPADLPELLRDAYEHGYSDGQNNPNGYGDKADRDKCVAGLLDGVAIAPADPLHQQLADVTHQRDLLAKAIGDACIKAGITRADAELTGPQLLMLADGMADTIINLNSVSAADQ